MTPAGLIDTLALKPHLEGGHYSETFRDARTLAGTTRAASTAIYFLLQAGEVSRWHTVDAVEIWHFYAGDPLEITIKATGVASNRIVLGPDIATGQCPQVVVPALAWQMARPLGAWTLVGCTVAPGFDFAGFKLAEPGFDPCD